MTPRARSPHQSFPAPGVVLVGAGQHSAGSSSVTLARVNTDTSGRYTCEVSNYSCVRTFKKPLGSGEIRFNQGISVIVTLQPS